LVLQHSIENRYICNYVCIQNRNTFTFYIVFTAQGEYSYFSADFRLKIFLWIFLDYNVRYFRFMDFDGVEVILEPVYRQWSLIWYTQILVEMLLASNIQCCSYVLFSGSFYCSEKGRTLHGFDQNIKFCWPSKFSPHKIILILFKSQPRVYSKISKI